MSNRTFERAVLDWLEDGSDRTPRPAIDAVLLAVKTTPQERALRIPRRFSAMPTNLRLAAVVAVIAVVGVGALTLNGRGPGVGGSVPPATATPTPTDTPVAPSSITRPAMDTAFVSPAFGYDAMYPAGWEVKSGTTQGNASELAITEASDGPARFWDHFAPAAGMVGWGTIAVTTSVLPRGMTEDAWIAAYQAPQVEQAGRACIPERSRWERITIDGRSGGVYVGCLFVEALIFDGRRIFIFNYINGADVQSSVATNGRDLLEAFVDTVTLHPERVSTPPPTAS
jgi:hypothetical protein